MSLHAVPEGPVGRSLFGRGCIRFWVRLGYGRPGFLGGASGWLGPFWLGSFGGLLFHVFRGGRGLVPVRG